MPVILVANPKGGVGKSTIASNIAGYWARAGHRVMLGDIDSQQSSRQWLDLRPPQLPRIERWDVDGKLLARPPKGVTHIVLDTPAGLHGKKLDGALAVADKILIPLQPSLFDIQATFAFIEALKGLGQTKKLALVGMRARDGTLSSQQLQQFVQGLGVPVLGLLRDTQNYVHLAARGASLWDVGPSRVERDLEQWQSVCAWLDR